MHRDLKPENILLCGKLHCKLSDFGDSKVYDPKTVYEPTLNVDEEDIDDRNSLFQDSNRTNQPRGSFVGTPLYVTPEMLTDNSASPASDLWALGVMIYQMRVGMPPFNGQNELEVFEKITSR